MTRYAADAVAGGPAMTLPTLFDPRTGRTRERMADEARLWSHGPRRGAAVRIVPDLSVDVLCLDGGLSLAPRTLHASDVWLDRSSRALGLRLPVAARRVHLAADLEPWFRRGLRARVDEEELLAEAVESGRIAWTLDESCSRFLDLAAREFDGLPHLAAALAMSERTLRRRCGEWFGASPVYALRVLRLWRFVDQVAGASLAAASAASGYADQAHATREVAALTGYRPRELARLRLAE